MAHWKTRKAKKSSSRTESICSRRSLESWYFNTDRIVPPAIHKNQEENKQEGSVNILVLWVLVWPLITKDITDWQNPYPSANG